MFMVHVAIITYNFETILNVMVKYAYNNVAV